MSVFTEIQRIISAKNAIKEAVNAKGGTLTDELISEYAQAISDLPSGGGVWIKEAYDETYVGSGTFDFSDMIAEVIVPQGFTSSGVYTDFANLKKVTLPDSVTTITKNAFKGTALEEISSLEHITTIQEGGFYGVQCIKDLDLPNLTSIAVDAFRLSSIERIINLGTITTLPGATAGNLKGPFYDCHSLLEAIIPATLTNLGARTFYSCGALKKVTCFAVTPPKIETNTFYGCPIEEVRVPAESVSAYQSATYWSGYNVLPIE